MTRDIREAKEDISKLGDKNAKDSVWVFSPSSSPLRPSHFAITRYTLFRLCRRVSRFTDGYWNFRHTRWNVRAVRMYGRAAYCGTESHTLDGDRCFPFMGCVQLRMEYTWADNVSAPNTDQGPFQGDAPQETACIPFPERLGTTLNFCTHYDGPLSFPGLVGTSQKKRTRLGEKRRTLLPATLRVARNKNIDEDTLVNISNCWGKYLP